MEYLSAHYTVVPLDQILISVNDRQHTPAVAITFDDAYTNVLEHALPVLLEFGLPATVYAPTRYLGLKNFWDETPPHLAMRIMGHGHLREIYTSGLGVGSHSQNHLRLKDLPLNSLTREIFDSRKELEDIIGAPVTTFAYPYGGRNDFDERAPHIARNSGYASAVTSCFGRCHNSTDRHELPRLTICPDDTVSDLKAKLRGYYDWVGLKEHCVYTLRLAAN
ncbi:MAG: polysaccharide deacetylase family protein [Thermodesulfobacteriota bacterium]|nr:polysaccharide deacetylase family protein [Thermodesulfobacteriota bacterium]